MVTTPCGVIGDIDGDGDITQADVDLAFIWVDLPNLTPDQLKRLDVNGNGRPDFNDVVLIGQYARGEIATFPACPKYVGQIIHLTSTPTGGTPGVSGYTVEFRRGALPGTALPGGTFTGVSEGSLRTMDYTLVPADIPLVTVSVYITDNCPSGALNNTDQRTITVETCNVPACGFVVA